MELFELLTALCEAPGVSGDEESAAKVAVRLLEPLGAVSVSPLGSVVCRMPPRRDSEKAPRVLLTAHLDQVGLMVTRITDEGFLRVAPCGGPDRRSLAGARVTVHTASGSLAGVICSVPPHLSDGGAKTVKAEDCAVDIGCSAARARELCGYGDRITLDGPLIRLTGDRVCAAALDDRAGCAAVIQAAALLRKQVNAQIVVALVTREEVGSAGAATTAFAEAPDVAFAVDVSMGSTPDDRPERCGTMGAGPMIGFSPVLDRTISKKLTELARREGIAYQTEVMAGYTGTDCDWIAPSGAGVRTALLSIPLRFMHTPSEIIALADLENTVRLLEAAIGGRLCWN